MKLVDNRLSEQKINWRQATIQLYKIAWLFGLFKV